jgi:enterochelin esterase-like enzyme
MRQPSFSIVLRQAAAGTLAAAVLLAGTAARAGSIEAAEFKSPTLQRSWTYNVYLPTGYDAQSKLRYPVMYLLHGNDGQRNDWPVKGNLLRTVDQLIQNGEIPPAIIVMPDAGTTWYVDLKEPMETAFFQDLVPHVEKKYRTLTSRDGRVIGGLSMGGYGALRYVLKYPEKFQAAALLSPAIYNPEPPADSSARSVKVFAEPNTGGQYSTTVWKSYNYPVLWDSFLAR